MRGSRVLLPAIKFYCIEAWSLLVILGRSKSDLQNLEKFGPGLTVFNHAALKETGYTPYGPFFSTPQLHPYGLTLHVMSNHRWHFTWYAHFIWCYCYRIEHHTCIPPSCYEHHASHSPALTSCHQFLPANLMLLCWSISIFTFAAGYKKPLDQVRAIQGALDKAKLFICTGIFCFLLCHTLVSDLKQTTCWKRLSAIHTFVHIQNATHTSINSLMTTLCKLFKLPLRAF